MSSAGKKNLAKSRPGGYLIAVIGDADTVAGFLMAGVGERDGKKDVNYFEVDLSALAGGDQGGRWCGEGRWGGEVTLLGWGGWCEGGGGQRAMCNGLTLSGGCCSGKRGWRGWAVCTPCPVRTRCGGGLDAAAALYRTAARAGPCTPQAAVMVVTGGGLCTACG